MGAGGHKKGTQLRCSEQCASPSAASERAAQLHGGQRPRRPPPRPPLASIAVPTRRDAAHYRDLHSRGQDVPMPVIEGLDTAMVSLTAREAQSLVVSVRTVESHIHRAMHKLGVSDRRDLRTGPSQVQ